jgi:hypothetical protein
LGKCFECGVSFPEEEDQPGDDFICWACAMDHIAEDEWRANEVMWVCAWCHYKNCGPGADQLYFCEGCELPRDPLEELESDAD